jgi:hypothetical protein
MIFSLHSRHCENCPQNILTNSFDVVHLLGWELLVYPSWSRDIISSVFVPSHQNTWDKTMPGMEGKKRKETMDNGWLSLFLPG